MEINVARIARDEDIKENFVIEDSSENRVIVFNEDNYKVLPPIKVEGTLKNYEGKIEAHIIVTAKVRTVCSRCLEEYTEDIHTSSNLTFVKQESIKDSDGDIDYYPYKGDHIDITESVIGEIAAALPMKPLCNSNCKGLCYVCGSNNNISNCDCSTGELDSRMQILGKLLDEERGGV